MITNQAALVTSIPPRISRLLPTGQEVGEPYLYHCLKSWHDGGFAMHSLNEAAEISELAARYPFVTFHAAARIDRSAGPPLVPVAELLALLARLQPSFGGIVNADILAAGGGDLLTGLAARVPGSFIYGHRIDIDDLTSGHGAPYRQGYDFWFFEPARLAGLADAGHVMGRPWWDLWLPAAASLAGLRLVRAEFPVGFHLRHPERADPEQAAYRDYYGRTLGWAQARLADSADATFQRFFEPCRALDPDQSGDWRTDSKLLGIALQYYQDAAAEAWYAP